MFVVTNRNIQESKSGFDVVGNRVNTLGPAELRILEITQKGSKKSLQLYDDLMTDEMKAEIGNKTKGKVLVSEYMFHRLVAAVNPALLDSATTAEPRDLVLFVHGFNNTLEDVATRCLQLSRNFDVEVLAFSWPANGGGLRGVTDYLDDKRDAQASVVAFDRVLRKAHELIKRLRETELAKITAEAQKRFPESGEKQREFIAKAAEKHCPVRVSLLLHSMGNYLLERTLKSSALNGDLPLFDNVVLCAADVNNEGHAEWVDRIQVRNRLYVTINESDSALRASRLKGGDEQKARLGHWTKNLFAKNAVYVNFTDVKSVGSSHAYFEEEPLTNTKIRKFFSTALHGGRAEDAASLVYDSAKNLYLFP